MSQKTLKDILREKKEQQERAARPQVTWFSLKKKNPVKVQFLQELDEDAPNYDSSRGKALFLVEHSSPYDFRHRAVCTLETEGRCFACEMNQEDPVVVNSEGKETYPWGQKTNLYIWVADEDGELSVLSRPAFNAFSEGIYSFAEDEGEGSIIGQTFKISKAPEKNASWQLTPVLKAGIDVPEIAELVDLEKAVAFKVAYADQRKFYIPEGATKDKAPEDLKPVKNTTDIDW